MEYIKIFIIVQVLLLLFQKTKILKLDTYQYLEMISGSVLIIVIFGLLGYLITLDFLNPKQSLINNSALFASLYAIWYYSTHKITNKIHSDNNGVVYYN